MRCGSSPQARDVTCSVTLLGLKNMKRQYQMNTLVAAMKSRHWLMYKTNSFCNRLYFLLPFVYVLFSFDYAIFSFKLCALFIWLRVLFIPLCNYFIWLCALLIWLWALFIWLYAVFIPLCALFIIRYFYALFLYILCIRSFHVLFLCALFMCSFYALFVGLFQLTKSFRFREKTRISRNYVNYRKSYGWL